MDAKQQAEKRPFAHVMIPHFTGTRFRLDENSKTPAIGQYYDLITDDDLRNSLIIEDVMNCIKDGRNCLRSANAHGMYKFWLISYANRPFRFMCCLADRAMLR